MVFSLDKVKIILTSAIATGGFFTGYTGGHARVVDDGSAAIVDVDKA